MDGELKNLKCNINQLAAMTELHRQTVANRLKDVPLAPGSNEKKKLYLLTDVIKILMAQPTSEVAEHQDPKKMTPKERKDWFDSEKGRIWLEEKQRLLIPESEVFGVYAATVKTTVQLLETLPDKLERDAGMLPKAVEVVQKVVDDFRIELAESTYQACLSAMNGEEENQSEE